MILEKPRNAAQRITFRRKRRAMLVRRHAARSRQAVEDDDTPDVKPIDEELAGAQLQPEVEQRFDWSITEDA